MGPLTTDLVRQWEHDGFNSAAEVDQAQAARVNQFPEPVTPLPVAPVDPLRAQLLAHFDQLSAYGKRIAVAQLSSLASLCKHCPKE